MYVCSRENLFLDDVYGLLIVFTSLLGFISMVWLKDQLGNGGGPNWLARDQREVNQLRMHEAQEQVNVLRHRLQQAGERARQRENAPERVAAATEILQLQNTLAVQTERLEEFEREKYESRLDELEQRKRRLIEGVHSPDDSTGSETLSNLDRATPTFVTPRAPPTRADHSDTSEDRGPLSESHDREWPSEWEGSEVRQELFSVNQELEALKKERDEYVANIER